eukprot:11184893-Lingulodinium_polyedra.AAC.1
MGSSASRAARSLVPSLTTSLARSLAYSLTRPSASSAARAMCTQQRVRRRALWRAHSWDRRRAQRCLAVRVH